jgi:hypothetical protein
MVSGRRKIASRVKKVTKMDNWMWRNEINEKTFV